MKTEELETHLREVLRERAGRITAEDLAPSRPGERDPGLVERGTGGGAWARPLAAAAVVLVLVALVAAGLMGRGDPAAERLDQQGVAGQPTPGPDRGARAWPLTNDEPLPANLPADRMTTPEAATDAYLTEVVGLPPGWPIAEMLDNGKTATAKYVLQDVPGEVHLAKTDNGLWYVTFAQTEFIKSALPAGPPTGFDLSIEPGPRMYENGADVEASALAADGRLLARGRTRLSSHRNGQAAAAAVVSLKWDGQEMAAVIRAEVKDDHDGDASTPDATIGHFTVALPALTGRPQGVAASADMDGAPLFSAPGSVDDVALAYMKDRFPDYPAPGVELQPAVTRARRAYVLWTTGSGGESHSQGQIWLRKDGDAWSVLAATANDVDPSGLSVMNGTVTGRVTTSNINSLFADVFQPDGTPAAGSPRPDGQPDAQYRFGTAGGPGDGSLDIDVAVEPGSAVIRVNLVGGTILSITEFRLPVPQPGE